MSPTVINYYGKQIDKCGYCKGTKCSNTHGMHAYCMSPTDYQDLIDRGWRRSGYYCYKPDNKVTCCPCYTIKCDATEFKLSKSHKKILKRMNRFLRDGKKDKNEEVEKMPTTPSDKESGLVANNDGADNTVGIGINAEPRAPDVPLHAVNLSTVLTSNGSNSTIQKDDSDLITPEKEQQSQLVAKDVMQVEKIPGNRMLGARMPIDSNEPPCRKAKQMRLERKQAKLAAKGITASANLSRTRVVQEEKTLSDYINTSSPDDKHKLKIIIVPSNKQTITDEAFNLYRKYQLIIHNDNPQRLTTTSLQRFLYKSPLQYSKTLLADGTFLDYGSFHQQYWLDKELIAVGVIDILPNCVSSVYFFYNPDYNFLSLGTYGSLREIEFVQQLAKKVPALKNYYMGFYIHSCPKMRYKGKLVPSYLLCPETYTWNLLNDDILSKLNVQKYQRLNEDPEAKDSDEFLEHHLNDVQLILENHSFITYGEYIQITGDEADRESILEYGKLVGKTCAHRIRYLKI